MRIALFTDHDPTAPNGLATTLAALVGHSPHDISFIPYSDCSGAFHWVRADQILQRAQYDRIDLIHATTSGPAALLALYVGWRLDVPVVGSFSASLASTLLGKRYLRALSELCECVFVSSLGARDTIADATADAAKLVTWRPGVDSGRFTPSKRSAGLRERWQVSDPRPAVLYVGSLSEETSAQRLLSLEIALRRSQPMHRLIVVGDGPSRAELEARCDHAVFLRSIPHEDIPQALASADLFVCPSETYSAHHAVLEAQASGLPVVLMAHGSARERVCAASAVLCRSTVDLIIETAALVRNDVRRKTMGRAAREYALRQRWATGLAPLYSAYRMAAEISKVRGDLRPTFVSQSRRS